MQKIMLQNPLGGLTVLQGLADTFGEKTTDWLECEDGGFKIRQNELVGPATNIVKKKMNI